MIATGAAAGARIAADVSIAIVAWQGGRTDTLPPRIENGGTATVQSLVFRVGVSVANSGPDVPSIRVRFELPPGLSWGTDEPDPSEGCVGTSSTATCEQPVVVDTSGRSGWAWDVVAAAAGSYPLRGEILSSTSSDPNATNNAAAATVIVAPRAPTPSASAVTVSPRRPRAGSVVTGRVGVTLDGAPVMPTALRCRGRVGRASITGRARSAAGTVTCSYRTRASQRGRTLVGTLTFAAEGRSFSRRFSVKLR
jgi:hypothetical protein